jgi:hypothetical protein
VSNVLEPLNQVVLLTSLLRSFRSDWLWLDDTGRVTTYINQRGQGDGMIPHWDSVGVTHGGMGEAGARSQIRFARLYDSGRADVSDLPELSVSEALSPEPLN